MPFAASLWSFSVQAFRAAGVKPEMPRLVLQSVAMTAMPFFSK